jgi:hypothetical protein
LPTHGLHAESGRWGGASSGSDRQQCHILLRVDHWKRKLKQT